MQANETAPIVTHAVAGPARGLSTIRRWGRGRLIAFVVVTMAALVFVFPLYWMVMNSFQDIANVIKMPPEFFPSRPTLVNYTRLLVGRMAAWRWFLNSAIISTCGMIVAVGFSSLSGYAFGKMRFPGRDLLFWLLLSTMMVPTAATLIPLFIQMVALGLYNTLVGMFITIAAWPFAIFLVRQYMQSIPDELLDAARIDGASEFGLFWRIVIPLAKPALGVLAILAFIGVWENYLWQLVMARTESKFTLLVGVSTLTKTATRTDYGLQMAGATLAFGPMLLVFMRFQSYFLSGITMGSLKG